MPSNRIAGLLLAAGLLLPGWAAAEVTVAGIRYEESAELRGARLQLNGAASRWTGCPAPARW